MLSFLAVCIFMVLLAVSAVVVPLLRGREGQTAPVAGTVSAVLMPAGILLIYALVTSYPWQSGAPSAAAAAPAPSSGEAQSMAAAIRSLEQRLRTAPNDINGWLLLGRSYVSQQRFSDAGKAYRQVLELTNGRNTEAKTGLAEAMILSDRRAFAGQAGTLLDEVLAVEPDNRKALWYGGQAALVRNDTATARQRWSRLLALSPPDSLRKILEIQLQALDTPAGTPVTVQHPVASTDAAPAITVNVRLEEALRKKVKKGARLFIVARDADRTAGPPLAAVPKLASELPLTVRITDADRMIPDRSLADIARIKVIARVANGGDALAAPGDIFGEALWQRSKSSDQAVSITLNQVVE